MEKKYTYKEMMEVFKQENDAQFLLDGCISHNRLITYNKECDYIEINKLNKYKESPGLYCEASEGFKFTKVDKDEVEENRKKYKIHYKDMYVDKVNIIIHFTNKQFNNADKTVEYVSDKFFESETIYDFDIGSNVNNYVFVSFADDSFENIIENYIKIKSMFINEEVSFELVLGSFYDIDYEYEIITLDEYLNLMKNTK